MEKKFDLSKQFNKTQKINKIFYIIMVCLVCIGLFATIIHGSMDKNTILGALVLISFFAIYFIVSRVADKFLSGCKNTNTLIYTFYHDRILYQDDTANDVVFIDELDFVSWNYDKQLSYDHVHFSSTNGYVIWTCNSQRDFYEYFKKYLNERGINNNL